MALVNGNGVNRGADPHDVGRDRSKHWCGECHGNPACRRAGMVKGDPVKLAEWKARRASQVVPYAEDHGV